LSQDATAQKNFQMIRELGQAVEQQGVHLQKSVEKKASELRLQTKILVESMIEGQTKAEQTKHRERIETRLRVIVFRMQQSSVASAFGTWAHTVTRARRIEAVKHNAALRFKNFMVSSCFATWSETAMEQVLRRNEATARDNFIRLVDLEKAFESEVGQRHYEVGQINAVLNHINDVLESNETSEKRRRTHRIKKELRRLVFLMKSDLLRSVFLAWADLVSHSRRTRHLVTKSLLRMRNRLVARCFDPWATIGRMAVRRNHVRATLCYHCHSQSSQRVPQMATTQSNCCDIQRMEGEFSEHQKKFKLLASIFSSIDAGALSS
jgi:hypothetical protein